MALLQTRKGSIFIAADMYNTATRYSSPCNAASSATMMMSRRGKKPTTVGLRDPFFFARHFLDATLDRAQSRGLL